MAKKVKKVTIKIPYDVLYDLILLVDNSKDTGVEYWDSNMKIISEALNETYNNN